MKVQVIAAHPDDEILGVGGTVAMHVQRGDCVQLAILCEGVSVRYDPERQAEVRGQSLKAASVLGVSNIITQDFQDQGLDGRPIIEITREVEKLIQSFQPETVYTQFGGDLNRDHRVLAEAVMVATRPYAAPFVREVLMYETPSSTEWSSPHLSPMFQPHIFVDITSTLEKKLDAFACYAAEVCPEPHPRSLAALRQRAGYWGSLVNRAAAEPFVCVRSLR